MKTFFTITLATLVSCTGFGQIRPADKRIISQEERVNEQYCSGLFKSTDGKIFTIEGDNLAPGYMNILDWMQGRVAGFRIYHTRSGIRIPLLRGGVPGIFIDEVQVSPSNLDLLTVSDIAIVKVIREPFLGGFGCANGAIAVYKIREEEEDE